MASSDTSSLSQWCCPLSPNLTILCESLSQLPANLKSQLLARVIMTIDISNLDLKIYLDFFQYLPQPLDIKICVSASGEKFESAYTDVINLDGTLKDLKRLGTLPVTEFQFSDINVQDYLRFFAYSDVVTFRYSGDSKKVDQIAKLRTRKNVKRFNSRVVDIVPSMSYLHKRFPKINRISVIIDTNSSRKEIDRIHTLAELYFVDVEILEVIDPSYYEDFNFKSLIANPNIIVIINKTAMPPNDRSIHLLNNIKIRSMHVSDNFESIRKFEKLGKVTLTNYPKMGFQLDLSKSVKTLICLSKSKDKLRFNFENMVHLKFLAISARITKYSFESIPQKLEKLSLVGRGSLQQSMKSFELPPYLSAFECLLFPIGFLPSFTYCSNLRTFEIVDCFKTTGAGMTDEAATKLLETLPGSLATLKLKYLPRQVTYLSTPNLKVLQLTVPDHITRLEIILDYPCSKIMTFLNISKKTTVKNPYKELCSFIHFNNISKGITFRINKACAGIYFPSIIIDEVRIKCDDGSIPKLYKDLPNNLFCYSLIAPPPPKTKQN